MEPAADTLQKALRINLDPRWYGTIAEIGAGQEVARWFFRAGGAAGTVAKSHLRVRHGGQRRGLRQVATGTSRRAGCRRMLDHEFQLNVERLDDERGDDNASSRSPTRWWRAATGAATSATAGWA